MVEKMPTASPSTKMDPKRRSVASLSVIILRISPAMSEISTPPSSPTDNCFSVVVAAASIGKMKGDHSDALHWNTFKITTRFIITQSAGVEDHKFSPSFLWGKISQPKPLVFTGVILHAEVAGVCPYCDLHEAVADVLLTFFIHDLEFRSVRSGREGIEQYYSTCVCVWWLTSI